MTYTYRGFTLLLSVLISGILLALGSAIYNIASKELILASAGRDSQFAFYAADSGIECALFWDYQYNSFSSTTPSTPIACGEGTIPPGDGSIPINKVITGGPLYTETTTFNFSLGPLATSPCTFVSVVHTSNPTRTVINSAGYNTCVTTNPRRIERAIRVQY